MTLDFVPLTAEDLPRVHGWLRTPHVARWWHDDDPSYDKVVADYLPGIEGRELCDHYLIAVDERPVGLIQTYLASSYPDWEATPYLGSDEVAGVDLFIGEEDLLGQGLGGEVIRTFVADIVFARPATKACVAGVEPANTRSLRAFAKAGFRSVVDYDEEGRPHVLLRLDRSVEA